VDIHAGDSVEVTIQEVTFWKLVSGPEAFRASLQAQGYTIVDLADSGSTP
jgi:hypothetical protein